MSDKPKGGKTTLTGYLLVPGDRIEAVRAALPRHIELSRSEPGCLAFEVTENASEPGRFAVHEAFTNRAAFDAHQRRAAASAWAGITAGMERNYRITQAD